MAGSAVGVRERRSDALHQDRIHARCGGASGMIEDQTTERGLGGRNVRHGRCDALRSGLALITCQSGREQALLSGGPALVDGLIEGFEGGGLAAKKSAEEREKRYAAHFTRVILPFESSTLSTLS
jgi:hypothetical protein